MKIRLSLAQKAFLAFACFAVAVIGFMVKLPSGFRHVDKELHAAFYFCAAALLNFLFVGTKLFRHALVFAALYLFGMAIEYAQEYSNKFYRIAIHGRYDPEDLQWNLKGLIAFSCVWIVYVLLALSYKSAAAKNGSYHSKPS